jgi:hypothetical protein
MKARAQSQHSQRFALVSCEIFYREMAATIARSPNLIDLVFLPKGLHDIGCHEMLARIQASVDAIDTTAYDAILLGYGLCNNGLVGLAARDLPLVLPRAHDCITLFLGSRSRYVDYFNANPGTYFKTTGWIERAGLDGDLQQLSIQRQSGMDQSLDGFIAKYGEENGRFLFETLCQQTRNYGQYTFIEMGVEPDDRFAERTRQEAAAAGWKFDHVQGDMCLIERLINGDWRDDEFLVVPPGHQVATAHDHDRIVTTEPAGERA